MSCMFFFFFKQKTAYEMRISDWSSDVCSSDLHAGGADAALEMVAIPVHVDRALCAAVVGDRQLPVDLDEAVEGVQAEPHLVGGVDAGALGRAFFQDTPAPRPHPRHPPPPRAQRHVLPQKPSPKGLQRPQRTPD